MSNLIDAALSPRTTFFQHCPMVFQGGGCRAVALAGAYKAALQAGVHATRVAGTSAGSIMAALVGAWATPERILQILSNTPFASFLTPPEPIGHDDRKLRFAAKIVSLFGFKDYANLLELGGFHSSRAIEVWLNSLLAELLPNAKPPVSFGDLLISTSVVATDLRSERPHVWSTDTTPAESVAFAVRASCSIPIFFQPVVQGDSRLVDGGVLSNLPTFVFAHLRTTSRSISTVLALELKGDDVNGDDWSPRHTLNRLINTVIAGATDVQLTLHPSVHVVRIRTGITKATDFASMNDGTIKDLVSNGASAMRAFIENEASYFRGSAQEVAYFYSNEELYYELATQADSPSERIWIAAGDTIWFWKVFPTVLAWVRHRADIEVFVPPAAGSIQAVRAETARRPILELMGITVTETKELSIFGFVFLQPDRSQNAAIVMTGSTGTHAPLAVRYRGTSHSVVIDSICSGLHLDGRRVPASGYRPELEHLDWPTLRARLKLGVDQYRPAHVSLELEEVNVPRLRPLTRVIRAYKYRQVEHLAAAFRERGIELFGAARVRLDGGAASVVTPPVIEVHGPDGFVIEGNTRTYYCAQSGIERMRAIVVRGVDAPLPASSVDLRQLIVSTEHLEPDARMPGHNYSYFRHIEAAAHPLE